MVIIIFIFSYIYQQAVENIFLLFHAKLGTVCISSFHNNGIMRTHWFITHNSILLLVYYVSWWFIHFLSENLLSTTSSMNAMISLSGYWYWFDLTHVNKLVSVTEMCQQIPRWKDLLHIYLFWGKYRENFHNWWRKAGNLQLYYHAIGK